MPSPSQSCNVPLLVLAVVLFAVSDTVRTPPPDASGSPGGVALDESEPVRIGPVVPIGALYSGTFGPGLGAGVRVQNLGWEGSDVSATAFGALYGYGAQLALATGDPYGQPVYGRVWAEASRATRRRYYGTGPFTAEGDRLDLDHRSATVEARLGVYPFRTTALLVQPSVRLLVDRLDPLTPETRSGLDGLDPVSQEAVRTLEAETRLGVSVGVGVASDRLDVRAYPSSGTYTSLEARRFEATDGTGLGFSRVAASLSGYLPVRRRTVVAAHAVGAVTRPDDGATLPFVYLPTLDSALLLAYSPDRFRGRDVLAFGVGLRAPVASVYGLFGVDAEVTAALGAAYDDVAQQFKPSVSFDPSPEPGDAAPLRPAASVALRFVDIENRSVFAGGRVGVSPDGVVLALVSVRADLRDLVPLFR